MKKPPLTGTWRYHNGILCCGTLRIAEDSFDTDPSPEFEQEVFGWVCEVLNKAVEESLQEPTEGDAI